MASSNSLVVIFGALEKAEAILASLPYTPPVRTLRGQIAAMMTVATRGPWGEPRLTRVQWERLARRAELLLGDAERLRRLLSRLW